MKYSTKIFASILFFCVSIISNAQTLFTKYEGNPVLRVGPAESWESKQVSHPRILFDGEIYRMWYAGNNDTCRQIGYATSTDGVNWMKHPGNPVLEVGERGAIDDLVVSPGAVVHDGTRYHMYYTARSYMSTGSICHATSPDGISWTKDDANNPVLKRGEPGWWDDYGLSAGPVLTHGTKWMMWYNGFRSDTRWQSGIATSSDGIDWIKDTLSYPMLLAGDSGEWDEYEQWIGDVLFDGLYYEAFYFGNTKQRAIGYAVSRNGIAWGKYDGNPILKPDNSNDEKAFLFQSCVLKNGEEYKIWYSDGMTAQICYALSAALTPASAQEKADRNFAENKPVPTATKSESKQVPKEINPFTVSFDGQNVNFKNFVTVDGTKVMEFDVSIAKELTGITGSPSVASSEVTIKRIGDGAFVILKNGIVGVFPENNANVSTTSSVKSLATKENITATYENQNALAIVILTNNELAILNPKIGFNIALAELFDGRKMGSLAIVQDPDKPNCALVTENDVPILRVFADATNIDQSVQYYSPTALLGAR